MTWVVHVLEQMAGSTQGNAFAASDTGLIVGQSNDRAGHSTAVTWVLDGTLTTLPNPLGGGFATANSVSADGSVIGGAAGSPQQPVVWIDRAMATLTLPPGTSAGWVTRVARDGSAVYAGWTLSGGASLPTMWNNGTPSVLTLLPDTIDGTVYGFSADGTIVIGICGGLPVRWVSGVPAQLPLPAGDWSFPRASACSDNGNIVVGQVKDNVWPALDEHALIWTAGMVAEMPKLMEGAWHQAVDVSADGSRIIGTVTNDVWPGNYSGGMARGAIWIDGVLQPLLDTAPGDTWADAWGISSDGKLICGTSVVDPAADPNVLTPVYWVVPPPPKLGMDDLSVVTLPEPSENLISLEWSDDRGHVFGSPVLQHIGEAGEYRTVCQWRRLGYGRDRVFRISWSVPMRTVLQGAWIDAEPGET